VFQGLRVISGVPLTCALACNPYPESDDSY